MPIYMWRESEPETGIYWSSSLELISLSNDGNNWITIADKDIGATVAGTTSSSYGEWYNFDSIPSASSGFFIPTSTDWQNLMNLRQQITGSNSDDLIMQHLLIPGAGYKNASNVQSDIGAGLYWSSTIVNSSTAYGTRFYPTATFMDMFNHNKNNRLTVREFKTTSVQPTSSWTRLDS